MNMNADTPLTPGKARRVLQIPWITLVLEFCLIAIPVELGQFFIYSLPLSRLFRSALIMVFTVPVAWGTYYILVHLIERRELTELGFSHAFAETAKGIAIGALLFGSCVAILALAGSYKVLGMNAPYALLRPFFAAVSAGVFEEIVFRGVVFRIIERSLGSWIALAISAAIFGGLHLLNENATPIGAVAIMLTAGITLGGAFVLTRRLWLPMGIHFAWNFTQSGIFGTVVSGNQLGEGLLRSTLSGPDWLTGGAFGVEASIAAVAVGLIVGALFLWRASRSGNIVRWHRDHAKDLLAA